MEQPVQSSGLTTEALPLSSRPRTFLGQKSMQIPQALHHALFISILYLGIQKLLRIQRVIIGFQTWK